MTTKQWRLTWAPEGKPIGTVEARTAKAARRKAPLPYRKFLGEIGVEPVSLVLGQCGECWAINRHEPNCSKASLGDLQRWMD